MNASPAFGVSRQKVYQRHVGIEPINGSAVAGSDERTGRTAASDAATSRDVATSQAVRVPRHVPLALRLCDRGDAGA